ncbi:MAG: cupin domain-containing protein [Acetobacteraceae bacterium]|nr:cupin domain-containing protein [Acetobacteraceae bacterium]
MTHPIAIRAEDAPERPPPTGFPPDLMVGLHGRVKRPLGAVFGLRNFGVNLSRIPPGTISSLRHAHAKQDEFIFVLEGNPVLVTDAGETPLAPGMCAGFPAGTGVAHHLRNPGPGDAVYLEIGDRTPADTVTYPDNDVVVVPGPDGRARWLRKDGTPVLKEG